MALNSKIHRCLDEGLTRTQTFQRLCPEEDLPPICMEQVTRWFNEGLNFSVLPSPIHSRFLRSINLIFDEFQNTICVWPQEGVPFLLDSHFVLALCKIDGHNVFYLLDNHHGQKRQLQVIGLETGQIDYYHVEVINSEHLLMQIDYSGFYLVRLDLADLTLTFLNKFDLNGTNKIIIFDCKNRHHFCVLYLNLRMCWITRCRIDDSTIIVDHPLEADRSFYNLKGVRLDGDHLQYFAANIGKTELRDCNLLLGSQSATFQKLFELETTVEFNSMNIQKHFWQNNTCCMFARRTEESRIQLYVANLDSRRIFQVGYEFPQISSRMDLDFKFDGHILTLCAPNNADKRYVKRLALGRVETLENLALFNLRKTAIFRGSKVYDQVVSNFPPDLKPFPVCKPE